MKMGYNSTTITRKYAGSTLRKPDLHPDLPNVLRVTKVAWRPRIHAAGAIAPYTSARWMDATGADQVTLDRTLIAGYVVR